MNDLTAHTLRGVAVLPKQEIREWIKALETYMCAMPESLPLDTCPVKHTFAPGAYAREMALPKGILIVGKIHKHAHINVISKGRVLVLTDAGDAVLEAPCTFASNPGAKRVVYVLEDTVWTTVHVTDKTDLAEIEAEIIANEYSDIEIEGIV